MLSITTTLNTVNCRNWWHFLQPFHSINELLIKSFWLVICEKYFLSFPQKYTNWDNLVCLSWYIFSLSQFLYFLREVCLLFNFWMIELTIMFFRLRKLMIRDSGPVNFIVKILPCPTKYADWIQFANHVQNPS